MMYDFWLANLWSISNQKHIFIYNEGIDAKELYHMSGKQLNKLSFLKEEERKSIAVHRDKWNLEKEYSNFTEKGIGMCGIDMMGYPDRLKNIPNPPRYLFSTGGFPAEDEMTVAIVGARGRSTYGAQIARELATKLSKKGVTIISGMARGIDKDAHVGALEAKGRTFAVLGCGVDVVYPRENRYIYKDILSHGGHISELVPGAAAMAHNFPNRNRIISGLSDLVVVVEARKKSGSLITADYALEQGKDIYVVPGRITDNLSGGCNYLIKQGAQVICDMDEFVSEVVGTKGNEYTQIDFRKVLLEKDETLVYSLLDFRPIGVGVLVESLPYGVAELVDVLQRLVDKGFAKECMPNYFIKTI